MKIVKIKKAGSKYKITLDNGDIITTYDNVILKNNLLYSKSIDEKLLDKINNDNIYYQSYNKIVDMIARRLRSKYEIKQYLIKNKVLEKDINKIIAELEKIGLVNDYNYALAYTNDKMNLSLDGPYKIKKHLQQHKIDSEIINDIISKIDQNKVNEHLNKIILKKINTNIKVSEYVFKQKLKNYLLNQGYSLVDIEKNLEKINIKPKEDEMKKIYNKLSKKYKDDKLLYNLKAKLYNKGYTQEEINNFIEKYH